MRGALIEKTQNQGDFTFKYSRPDCERIVGTPPFLDFYRGAAPNIYRAHLQAPE